MSAPYKDREAASRRSDTTQQHNPPTSMNTHTTPTTTAAANSTASTTAAAAHNITSSSATTSSRVQSGMDPARSTGTHFADIGHIIETDINNEPHTSTPAAAESVSTGNTTGTDSNTTGTDSGASSVGAASRASSARSSVTTSTPVVARMGVKPEPTRGPLSMRSIGDSATVRSSKPTTSSMFTSTPTPGTAAHQSKPEGRMPPVVFRPNLKSAVSQQSGDSSTSTGSVCTGTNTAGTDTTGGIDLQAALAHSLLLKSVVSTGSQHLELKRGMATGSSRRPAHQKPQSQVDTGGVTSTCPKSFSTAHRTGTQEQSRHLLDLADRSGTLSDRVDSLLTYKPISLPLKVDATTTTTTQQSGDTSTSAAAVFKSSEDYMLPHGERDWILIQFPSALPPIARRSMEEQRQKLENKATGTPTTTDAYGMRMEEVVANRVPSSLAELPVGRLGKMQIFKSGRARLITGNHQYELNRGASCSAAQEVAAVTPANGELLFLGGCSNRLTVVPDIRRMIEERSAFDDSTNQ